MAHSLEPLLHPRAIAVVGASDNAARIGGRPIHFSKSEFQGNIYPINPNRETVQGLKAYAKVGDLPEVPDSAVISVPAAIAVDAIRECADFGVRSAVVFTSGFAEQDDDGARAQAEIADIARTSGMRIVGPNCLGVFTLTEGWYGTFANAPAITKVPPGPIGIASQSGAYGSHIYTIAQARGIGANYWVTTGNEVDVQVAEVIEYYVAAPDVGVIVAYAEGVKDADRLRAALEAARDAHKPVIFMKVGRTEVGAMAAASHTASLAGADAIYDALFKQYGVYRAETTEEMLDVAYACQFGKYPKGNRVSLQTISGGVGVQMADACGSYGLEVAEMPADLQTDLKAMIPYAAVRNPVDFTAQALNEPDLVEKNIRMTIERADYDAHAVYLAGVPASVFTGPACKTIFGNLRDSFPDEPMILSLTGDEELIRAYEAMGYPVIEDPTLMIRAVGALARFSEIFGRGRPDAPPSLPDGAKPVPDGAVGEFEAKAILAAAGIAMSRDILVDSAEAAAAAWAEIGGPVVLKIASPDILHKTEIGGVLLNLDDAAAVKAGFTTLMERARTAKPDARLDGVIVAEMVTGGVEAVAGVVRDPVFGPAVMFGLGGVFVEVLKDVTFRLAPFGVDEARQMIDEIQGRAMFDGVRGAPPADLDALAETLACLSVFAAANAERIESVDLNPLIVRADGTLAVDALIVPRGDG